MTSFKTIVTSLVVFCWFSFVFSDQINIHAGMGDGSLITDTMKFSAQDKPFNATFRFNGVNSNLMQIPPIEYEWNHRLLFWPMESEGFPENAISKRQFTTFVSYSQFSQRISEAKVKVWDSTNAASSKVDIGNMYYVLNNFEIGIRQYVSINHEWSKCAFYGASLIIPITKTFGDEWGRTSIYGLPSYGLHGGLYFTDNAYGGIASQIYRFRYTGISNDLLGSGIDSRNAPTITLATTFLFMGISFELPKSVAVKTTQFETVINQETTTENIPVSVSSNADVSNSVTN